MRFTQQEYEQAVARGMARAMKPVDEPEKSIQNQIAKYCQERGWIADRGSMAHRTFRKLGEPDFTVWADRGRVFSVECKTRTGKLSNEQLGRQKWMERLGHKVHVVRSLKEFVEIIL